MSDYEKQVDVLRWCSKYGPCEDCPFSPKCLDNMQEMLASAADAIEELYTIVEGYRSRMRLGEHWISVEERLPDDMTPVLVCADDIKRKPAEQVYGVDMLLSNGVWDKAGESWRFIPTHWMPLPEPPKEIEKK